MALVPFFPPGRPQFSWTLPSAVQLIRERRNLNNTFRSNQNHDVAWQTVANNLFAATGFVVTGAQCRHKFNALKRGIIFF